jgi:hypothetical protein
MSRTSHTPTGPELIHSRQAAAQSHDQAGRVRVRAHRMCGFLADQRSEAGSGQQDDGWYFFVQGRYSVQRITRLSCSPRSGCCGRTGFGFTRPPERIG